MKAVCLILMLFFVTSHAQEVSFLKLHSSFSSKPSEFAKKNFGKKFSLKARITGISRSFDATMYIISLNEGKGKVYVKTNEINEKVKDRLYGLRNEEQKNIDTELKVTLAKSEGSSLLFHKLESIKLIPIKKKQDPKKKEADKKKKKPEKKKKKTS